MPYLIDGDDLVVDARHEQLVDKLIADIDTGTPAPSPAPLAEPTAYSTASWTADELDRIEDGLTQNDIRYTFRDGELVVAAADTERVDQLIATILGTS